MLWWMVCWYYVFPLSVGLFQHFSCLFVCMSVWYMASICMSLAVCWLFLKWSVDSREMLCFSLWIILLISSLSKEGPSSSSEIK